MLIKCEEVSFAYENQMVLDNVTFQVNQGDYLCVVGENGSGKTTLMKGLLGLKAPVRGHIHLEEGIRTTQIGYLPQQTESQKDFPASVGEVVLSGCLNMRGWRPGYGQREKERVSANMKLMGITDLEDKCYKELSGGQQQRVLLARALCAAHKLLLLDEPFTGLDPLATAEFYKIAAELNRKHGMTVIMVSHAVREAAANASHILHLSNGGYFFGTTEIYKKSKEGLRFLGGQGCD